MREKFVTIKVDLLFRSRINSKTLVRVRWVLPTNPHSVVVGGVFGDEVDDVGAAVSSGRESTRFVIRRGTERTAGAEGGGVGPRAEPGGELTVQEVVDLGAVGVPEGADEGKRRRHGLRDPVDGIAADSKNESSDFTCRPAGGEGRRRDVAEEAVRRGASGSRAGASGEEGRFTRSR